MKRLLWLCVVLVCAFVALFILRPQRADVALHDLTWSERDGTINFEFLLTNLTDDSVLATVQLIAERGNERVEIPYTKAVGYNRFEIRLNAKEEKRHQGQMKLIVATSGDLTLLPYLTTRKVGLEPAPLR